MENNLEKEQEQLISKKIGYEAMLYVLAEYYKNSGSTDLTDVISGGEYWKGEDRPVDSAFWYYWIEAIEKVKRDGPMFKEFV
ncbi:hypothetical protein [Paenimyroides viscosum]|uniref:Uncharacterized protein n=1 Tax=Paenimyroides viscosum TaxID=2488729 RepID=A0A3P1APE1_9FLAO|nr:hypothetical protein [Paenimyroides viscosum]RRA90816.1 hypothetical protein EG242_13235 [Paenimyroides viscosum]